VTVSIRVSLSGSMTNGLRTALDKGRLSLWERLENTDGGVSEGYIKKFISIVCPLERELLNFTVHIT